MGCLGFYRIFYIISWYNYEPLTRRIFRYIYSIKINTVSFLGGIVQTVFYADFLYLYIKKYYSLRSP